MKKKSVKAKKPAKRKKASPAKKQARKFGSAYYAQSKRLGVRLLDAGDEAMYSELYTDAKTLEGLFAPLSPEAAKQSFARGLAKTHQKPWVQRLSVIVERVSNKPVGIASIKMVDTANLIAEVGMLLKPSARAKHFATEVSQTLLTSIFRRHTVAGLCTQIPPGHKIGERWVKHLGYTKSHEIPATNGRPAFNAWTISRETWANLYK